MKSSAILVAAAAAPSSQPPRLVLCAALRACPAPAPNSLGAAANRGATRARPLRHGGRGIKKRPAARATTDAAADAGWFNLCACRNDDVRQVASPACAGTAGGSRLRRVQLRGDLPGDPGRDLAGVRERARDPLQQKLRWCPGARWVGCGCGRIRAPPRTECPAQPGRGDMRRGRGDRAPPCALLLFWRLGEPGILADIRFTCDRDHG